MAWISRLDRALALVGSYAQIQAPSFSLTDSANWYLDGEELNHRRIWNGERLSQALEDLCLPKDFALDLQARLLQAAAEPDVARHLEVSCVTGQRTLKPHTCGALRLRATAISRAVYEIAESDDPAVVRHVVEIYARAVSTDKIIELSSVEKDSHALYGKALIHFVRALRVPGLHVGFVGYRVNDRVVTDFESWAQVLGLPEVPAHTDEQQARNKSAETHSRHLGLRVVETKANGEIICDGAFHRVMLWACLLAPWRFALKPEPPVGTVRLTRVTSYSIPFFVTRQGADYHRPRFGLYGSRISNYAPAAFLDVQGGPARRGHRC